MERKYYTPHTEEFYIGFEYETDYLKNGKWIKRKLGIDRASDFFEYCYKEGSNSDLRVKLLDKEDIESLGFTYLHETSFLFNSRFHLTLNETYINISDNLYNGTRVIFDGVIKSKSELQKLLIQLGIK